MLPRKRKADDQSADGPGDSLGTQLDAYLHPTASPASRAPSVGPVSPRLVIDAEPSE